MEPPHEGRRIRVSADPTANRQRCDICAAVLARGEAVCYCPCGCVHHSTCVQALGYCPVCERPYGAYPLRTERYDPSRPRGEICPACGKPVSARKRCPCGAVEVSPSGAFDCPECGCRVFGSEMRCSACGAEFAIEEVDQCPRCRAQVPSHAVRCACGCYVSGRCRRCGMQLRADDRVCPRCGRHRICH